MLLGKERFFTERITENKLNRYNTKLRHFWLFGFVIH